ncbi:MAG TPA: adenylate/guanylate cyclase domain-containing protein, partial [bacterium]
YYQKVGTSILSSGGSIGRFMGDGIVAYWNAPQDDAEHPMHAAGAVLRSRSNSEALNRRWESYGWPIMYTRFGLHIGDAIVGNIGLPDRMDYTAFGDCLNIASRLEGLNKFYGTQILLSAAMATALDGAVVTRWVDRVAPKGTTQPMEIMELVGMREGDDFICAGPAQARQAEHWDKDVMAPYLQRDWKGTLKGLAKHKEMFPNDPLLRLYEERCREFVKTPPDKNWDGVVRYDQK